MDFIHFTWIPGTMRLMVVLILMYLQMLLWTSLKLMSLGLMVCFCAMPMARKLFYGLTVSPGE